MKIKTSLIFTFIFITSFVIQSQAMAKIVEVESNDDFFRVKFFAQKELLKVSKLGNKLTLKTLNNNIYEELIGDLKGIQKNKFISKVINKDPSEGNTIYSVDIFLDKEVEVFSFYKNREKAYFVDLWKEKTGISQKSAAVKLAKPVAKKKIKRIKKVIKPKAKVVSLKKAQRVAKKSTEYRDFRYGAAFIWDYKEVAPDIKSLIHLKRKTPEFFYPVKDRDYEKDAKEAHLQLSINLYRKKKWGLMYKSIKLYNKKFGEDNNYDMNEYLKANALLRESKDKGELKPLDTSIAMFSNIVERSNKYEMRKGIYKYLIQYYKEKKDHVQTLQYSKRYFADAKENFDYEELELAADMILTSLAKLNQIEKIQGLVKDKTIIKIVPKQKLLAYKMFTFLKLGDESRVLKEFESFISKAKGKVLPSIYYNAAEAYFREAQYKKAIKIYDQYLSEYSYHSQSSQARLRIALANDILGRKESTVLELYKNAINRSNVNEISLEARVRYVALRSIRKNKLNSKDLEIRVFLDKTDGQKLSKNLERLLWLTRLRTFVKDEQYENALTFLTALPLAGMTPTYKKVFQGDGAEIIYGIIKQNYEKGNFGKAVRAWEIYKTVYFEKVAADPEIQFVVAKSYMNLGLWKGFERTYSLMIEKKDEKIRSFPIWVDRLEITNKSIIEKELQVLRNIKLGNWQSVDSIVSKIVQMEPKYPKASFYRAKSYAKRNMYAQAETEYEKFFAENVNFNYIDSKDLVDAVKSYSESIYEQAKYKKFLKITSALLQDTKKFKISEQVINNLKERINYLRLEILFNSNGKLALEEGKTFINDFKKSTYFNRVKFLLGRENIRLKNVELGKNHLQELIDGTEVASYIKEMARAELTLLNLENRTL